MSVRARLVSTLLGIALLLILPTLYAMHGLERTRDIVVDLQGDHAAALMALGRLETNLAELDRIVRSYVITAEPEFRASIAERMARSRSLVDRIDRAGYEAVAADVATTIERLDTELGRVAERVDAGDLDGASERFDRVEMELERTGRSLEPVAGAIDRRGDAQVASAQGAVSRTVMTTLVAAALAIVLAFVLAAWSTAALTSPLTRLRHAMARVAGGELSAPETLAYGRRDEIGDLSRSFRSMTRRLAELDRMRGEFLSMTSHDLKTPISVIHSYAEVLDQGTFGAVNDRQSRVLTTIRDQTRLLSDAVDELVEIGRVGAGGLRIETRRVDARVFFDTLRRAFEGPARQRRIAFTVDVGPDVPDAIVVDPVRLRNDVLGNLVSNAFKFTSTGGRIGVRAWCAEGRFRVEVSDTGEGIEADRLPHIFEPYYRASDAADIEGSGLGLAIARRVVEAHGGTIEAASERERGTCFRLELPLRDMDRLPRPATARNLSPPAPSSSSTGRVPSRSTHGRDARA